MTGPIALSKKPIVTRPRIQAPGPQLLADARKDGRRSLDEHDGKRLLAEIGIAVPAGRRVGTDEPLGDMAAALRAPFAVKGLSPDVLHKSDIGAVAVNVAPADLDATRTQILGRMSAHGVRCSGILIEEMAPPGTEMVIGGLRDPCFGPMIMCGLGGIFAEIIQDVQFAVCPLDETDAWCLLEALAGYPLLAGARGRPAADLDSLVELLLRLGGDEGLLTRSDAIAEFDLNPVIAYPDGLLAVDARFVLEGGGRE